MTEYLNRCKECGRTMQEVQKALGEDEVIFIAGMCIPCFVKKNPIILSDNPEDYFTCLDLSSKNNSKNSI